MRRRGFLAALAAVVAAPWVKPKLPWNVGPLEAGDSIRWIPDDALGRNLYGKTVLQGYEQYVATLKWQGFMESRMPKANAIITGLKGGLLDEA